MSNSTVIHCVVVEEEVQFSLTDLSRASRADITQLLALIDEGVLTPIGNGPESWQFTGASLHRARTALRLTRDLALNAAGVALVLDLLEEIATLKTQLRRLSPP
jgi:chaperone modulatory protein CbpM